MLKDRRWIIDVGGSSQNQTMDNEMGVQVETNWGTYYKFIGKNNAWLMLTHGYSGIDFL